MARDVLIEGKASAAVEWEQLTSPEIASLLVARPAEVGLLPVGATEQHGPHLPTGTDTVIATGLARFVSARTSAPVLPAVSVACSYGHGRLLAGTLSVSPEMLAGQVGAVADWAASSGLRRILAINAHMGNAAGLGVAADHLRLERPDLRFGVVHWWQASAEVTGEVAVDGDDIHANRAETAVMLALAPDAVRLDLIETADDEDRTPGLVFGYTAASLSINGVTGRPSEATTELGHRLIAGAVDAMAAMVERARVEEPPLVAHAPDRPKRPSPALTATRSGGRRC
jgi:creatinine amidohydrolase